MSQLMSAPDVLLYIGCKVRVSSTTDFRSSMYFLSGVVQINATSLVAQ